MNDLFLKIGEEKRNRIIEVAMEEFAEKGYLQASTNHMVKRLGISKGSLFKYFSSKLDLYKYILDYANNMLMEHLNTNSIIAANWREQLISNAAKEFDFHITNPHVMRFYRQMIRDLELIELEDLAIGLQTESQDIFVDMMKEYNLDQAMMLHVSFVVKGYNDYFYKTYFRSSKQEVKNDLKQTYIEGLSRHLSMIGGYDAN